MGNSAGKELSIFVQQLTWTKGLFSLFVWPSEHGECGETHQNVSMHMKYNQDACNLVTENLVYLGQCLIKSLTLMHM